MLSLHIGMLIWRNFGIFPEISNFVAFSQYADSYSLEYELIQPKNDMPTVERQQNSLSGLA